MSKHNEAEEEPKFDQIQDILLEEEALINQEDQVKLKNMKDNLINASYHIQGDLTEDVLTEGGKSRGALDNTDPGYEDDQNKQPESS